MTRIKFYAPLCLAALAVPAVAQVPASASRTATVPVTTNEQYEQTVLTCRTELVDNYRTYHVPVTRYEMQPRWVGRWNPFRQPQLVYREVPRIRWEARYRHEQIPVTRLVPEKRTVSLPVTRYQTVQTNPATTRPSGNDPFAPATQRQLAAPSTAPPTSAARAPIYVGSLGRQDGDPPRVGNFSILK